MIASLTLLAIIATALPFPTHSTSPISCFGTDLVHSSLVSFRPKKKFRRRISAGRIHNVQPPGRRRQTLLRYIQYGGIDEDDEEEERKRKRAARESSSSSKDQQPSSPTPARYQRLVVPIIGPIPALPPLLVGGEMTLDPPTPMQWRALQEAVVVHRNALQEQEEGSATGAATDGGTIDASPLVAIIDEVTGPASLGTSGHRYATLAAVVGITSKTTSDSDRPRTDDMESFYESMQAPGLGGDVIRPFSSTIRLVGVGRAVLKDYFYRTPSDLNDESEGHDTAASDEAANGVLNGHDDEDWDDDDDDDETEILPRIIMAQFSPLVDLFIDPSADSKRIGDKGAGSVYRSPVYAINELNSLSHKVNWMHDDRKRLVNGINAAKARLRLRIMKDSEEDGDVYEDYDGLGLAGSSQSASFSAQPTSGENDDGSEEDGMIISDFLSRFHGAGLPEDPLAQRTLAEEQQKAVDFLEGLDHLGLSTYGYYSSIPALTSQALKLFVPYYSEEHRSREEHQLEVASFVALRTLEGYALKQDLAWALQCRSTAERLQLVYKIMTDHRIKLEKMAEKISQELLDCGEECSDLW